MSNRSGGANARVCGVPSWAHAPPGVIPFHAWRGRNEDGLPEDINHWMAALGKDGDEERPSDAEKGPNDDIFSSFAVMRGQ